MVPESWLVSRELTERAGPWNEKLSLDDDGEYFSRVIMASEALRFIPDARSYYRWGNPGSLSSVVKRPDAKLASQFESMRSQISLLLSMENSPRTRSACLTFLRRGFIYFYPEKTEIVKQARDIARELGGTLPAPDLDWKYSMIKDIFGWNVAKNFCFRVPALKVLIRKRVDRLLYHAAGGA
jgi:hypothetical protein